MSDTERIAEALSEFVQEGLRKKQSSSKKSAVSKVNKKAKQKSQQKQPKRSKNDAFTYPRDRVVYITGKIEDESFTSAILERLDLLSTSSDDPIYVVINSEGGLKIFAFAIHDAIKALNVPVYTVVQGQAMSSAAIIFLAGERRIMTQYSTLLVHYARLGGIDEMLGEIELNNYKQGLRRTNKQILRFIMEKTGLSKKQANKLMQKEKRINAKKAVRLGFAHEII